MRLPGERVNVYLYTFIRYYHILLHRDCWPFVNDGLTNIKFFVVGTSLVVQWLRLCLPRQGVWGLIPGQEAKMLHGQKKKKKKQEQYCNKFNKELKNGLYQKRKLKEEFVNSIAVSQRYDRNGYWLSNSVLSSFLKHTADLYFLVIHAIRNGHVTDF